MIQVEHKTMMVFHLVLQDQVEGEGVGCRFRSLAQNGSLKYPADHIWLTPEGDDSIPGDLKGQGSGRLLSPQIHNHSADPERHDDECKCKRIDIHGCSFLMYCRTRTVWCIEASQ